MLDSCRCRKEASGPVLRSVLNEITQNDEHGLVGFSMNMGGEQEETEGTERGNDRMTGLTGWGTGKGHGSNSRQLKVERRRKSGYDNAPGTAAMRAMLDSRRCRKEASGPVLRSVLNEIARDDEHRLVRLGMDMSGNGCARVQAGHHRHATGLGVLMNHPHEYARKIKRRPRNVGRINNCRVHVAANLAQSNRVSAHSIGSLDSLRILQY